MKLNRRHTVYMHTSILNSTSSSVDYPDIEVRKTFSFHTNRETMMTQHISTAMSITLAAFILGCDEPNTEDTTPSCEIDADALLTLRNPKYNSWTAWVDGDSFENIHASSVYYVVQNEEAKIIENNNKEKISLNIK
mgnify:CR=1 FL=1